MIRTIYSKFMKVCGLLRESRPRSFVTFAAAVLCLLSAETVLGQHSVSATVHNLSISGPGEVKSVTESEVCKFCHVPHNAMPSTPLWGHAISTVRYQVPSIRAESGERRAAPQPDGSSKLCLSCHDGTVALGEIVGKTRPVEFQGSGRLRPGQRGFLGTDLSGSHPVSIVMPKGGGQQPASDTDMGLKPSAAVRADPNIKLDASGKIQCTTCHDPHSDAYYVEGEVPRFWVKPSVDEVCITCHVPL
jgi:hypothetical protein